MALTDPIESYLAELKAAGTPIKKLNNARHFVRQLQHYLRQSPVGEHAYRNATELTMRILPESIHEEFLDIIRGFHPYWLGESPSADENTATSRLPNLLADSKADVAFNLSVSALERLLFHARGRENYLAGLTSAGLNPAYIRCRTQLSDVISFAMKDHDISADAYRLAVDQLLDEIEAPGAREIIIAVAREYYYFLAQSSNAISSIQSDLDVSPLLQLLPSD
ncbi:hypothetical protein KSF73_08470 [Burkholderiaceae bacterium DAT-1]|nr:hypothetical protein [Burkholderiaceae bacterium DAT-1]